MIPISPQERAALENNSRVLRARERSLQELAQSPRCSNRAGAEVELGRVREELAKTYARLRTDPADGLPGRRCPRE